MNRRQVMMLPGLALAQTGLAQMPASPEAPQNGDHTTPDKILLKDYRPRSIYKIPKMEIKKAKYPVIDVHCHGARPVERLAEWVKTMDAVGIEKAVIFTGASTPERFGEAHALYSKYPGRFDLWCLFDLAGVDQAGFGPNAIRALEECYRLGALGVGEISDKGWGLPPNPGPHADNPRMDALWERCAQLGMPINIHVSDPIWSYQPMDIYNDGLMNGYTWRIDEKQPGILGHNGLIQSLERAVEKHRKTTFIACHLANLDYDLTRLGQMFDRHPNLYADIAARFAETAPIPRFVAQFFRKYPDRVLYGTDMAYNQRMFSTTFRVLESNDEHFYERDLNFNFDYHWPLNGFGLPDDVLKKVYADNARRAFQQAKNYAA